MSREYNRKDHFYNQAKEEGYQSRAAYKLKELQRRFSLLKKNSSVLDLGAAPGGWTQVALELLGPGGKVIAIDKVPIDEMSDPRLTFILGDLLEAADLGRCLSAAGGEVDVVLSDMSPKLTGISEMDQAQIVNCAEAALTVSKKTLKSDGSLVIKLFKGQDAEQFIRSARPSFGKVNRVELDATRSSSNEFYFVGVGFKSTR